MSETEAKLVEAMKAQGMDRVQIEAILKAAK